VHGEEPGLVVGGRGAADHVVAPPQQVVVALTGEPEHVADQQQGQGRGDVPDEVALAALADALLQSPLHREAAQQTLIAPLERSAESARMRMQQQAQSTRVEFFTVAREAGA
jgi:phosphonate C-P lyase system protein PhnG